MKTVSIPPYAVLPAVSFPAGTQPITMTLHCSAMWFSPCLVVNGGHLPPTGAAARRSQGRVLRCGRGPIRSQLFARVAFPLN